MGSSLRPIVELGVEEAYAILRDHHGLEDLPPLMAVENEDWGRDFVLSRCFELPEAELRALGFTKEDAPPHRDTGRDTGRDRDTDTDCDRL